MALKKRKTRKKEEKGIKMIGKPKNEKKSFKRKRLNEVNEKNKTK